MGIFTKDIKTMEDLFLHQLEDIYYAEQQLTKAIPKMADMATNADLKAGLKSHVIDTQNQIERLDKVFAKLGQAAERNRLPGDRRPHQGGRRDRRRSRGQGCPGCGHRREFPGGRAL